MRSISRLVLAFALCFAATVARADLKPGQPARDFEAATFAGPSLKLSSLRGKVVLVDFWASWCEPCKREIPILDKLAPKLRARGIEIVAVNIDDSKDTAADFVRSHDLKQLTVVNDAGKKIVGVWEPPKMPSSFVVDKGGVVRAVHGGFLPGDESKLEAELTALVGQ